MMTILIMENTFSTNELTNEQNLVGMDLMMAPITSTGQLS